MLGRQLCPALISLIFLYLKRLLEGLQLRALKEQEISVGLSLRDLRVPFLKCLNASREYHHIGRGHYISPHSADCGIGPSDLARGIGDMPVSSSES